MTVGSSVSKLVLTLSLKPKLISPDSVSFILQLLAEVHHHHYQHVHLHLTPSIFHSELNTWLFDKSFPADLFLTQDTADWFHGQSAYLTFLFCSTDALNCLPGVLDSAGS